VSLTPKMPTHGTPRAAPSAGTSEAAWINLTEDLIFAAAYAEDPRTGSITWRRCLDTRKIRHNPEDEDRKCRKLCTAIHREHATDTHLVTEWDDIDQRDAWAGSEREAIEAGIARRVEKQYPLSLTIQRAHAANDSPVFRLRHASLLPVRP
jgi:hypothetical protein